MAKPKVSAKRRISTENYIDRRGLKRLWVGHELADLLGSGMYGDTILESSINIAGTIKTINLYE